MHFSLQWLCKIILLAAWVVLGESCWGEPPDSVEFFENRIRPVLVKHCYECHSAEADEVGGSLVLDSSTGMLQGGDSGPVIQPGDAQASILISALRYESTEMPPQGQLPDRVIKDFERWVSAGAIDPRSGKSKGHPIVKSEIDLESGRQFWAFQPLQ
ncbi:MAG: xanthan lyase, partial [Pirellulales bacterium]|nr:xanthan lyase [Pirellulales bacterium]